MCEKKLSEEQEDKIGELVKEWRRELEWLPEEIFEEKLPKGNLSNAWATERPWKKLEKKYMLLIEKIKNE